YSIREQSRRPPSPRLRPRPSHPPLISPRRGIHGAALALHAPCRHAPPLRPPSDGGVFNGRGGRRRGGSRGGRGRVVLHGLRGCRVSCCLPIIHGIRGGGFFLLHGFHVYRATPCPAPSCHARQSQVPPAIPDHASRPSLNPPASHAHRSRVRALLIAPHAAHSQILRCQWKARPRRRRWKVHAFDGERTARRAYPYPDFAPLCPAHASVDGRDPDSARPRGVEVFGRHLHLHIAVPIKIIIIRVAFLVLSQIAGLSSCKSPSAWPQDKTHQRPCWNRGRSRRTRADRRACLASRQSPSLSGLFLSL
uniref:Uncharacterized protein n=2 Tax=Zea mays TaxID=4577 RepID=A0A804P7K9_MAIZE